MRLITMTSQLTLLPTLLMSLIACGPANRTQQSEVGNLASEGADGRSDALGSDGKEQTSKVTDENGSAQDINALPQQAGPRNLPAPTRPRFLGRWAVDTRYCSTKAWRFTATSLRTPAGSVCDFSDVKPVASGYQIAARCTAEGPPTDDVLEIRFAESAQAMMFESNSIADAGLVYCGPVGSR